MIINLWNTFLGYIRISYPRIPWILLFACTFFVLFELLQRKGFLQFKQDDKCRLLFKGALSFLYSFFFVLTLFNRPQGNHGFSLIPFESYRIALGENNVEILLQNLMNIAMYIPFGFLLPCCFRYFERAGRVLAATIICSVSIELIQGLAQIGYLEVDDIISNFFGAVLGVLLYKLVVKIKEMVKTN